jgi:hypothetical protein
MSAVRIFLLMTALLALSWFQFVNTASAREVRRSAFDLFDPRPPMDILLVGNSRMFTNDMPGMVRAIADSARAPIKYRVRMWALPGETFVGHARNPILAGLLEQKWDRVVLQGQSAAHFEPAVRADFATHGALLVERARAAGSRASLIVNWNYGDQVFETHPYMEAIYEQAIQADYATLAEASGAALVNVGRAWKRTEAAKLGFDLAPDGNHPSVHGTYLAALMVYAHLSGDDVARVTLVPDGMSAEDAAALREIARDQAGLAP